MFAADKKAAVHALAYSLEELDKHRNGGWERIVSGRIGYYNIGEILLLRLACSV